jgi:hypothetical protein
MLPTWMYSKSADALYVNLFAGTRVNVGQVGGTDVEVVQATDYPWDGAVRITLNPKTPVRFAVRIRAPRRDVSSLYRATPAADGISRITVNGTLVPAGERDGYVEIDRQWTRGDTIEVTLPMPIQRVYGSDRIAAGGGRPSPVKGKVALRLGPLVYNIEQVDQDINSALPSYAPLSAEWRPDLLKGVKVITGRFADGKPMLAIPNYARYHRNPPPAPPSAPPTPAAAQAPAGSPPAPRPAPPPPTSIVWMPEV